MTVSKPAVIVVTALLLLLCYASTLNGMVQQWWIDEDMGHGFLVPVVAAWVVWREREKWLKMPAQPSLWGFVFLAAGAAMHAAGSLGVGLFASSVGLLLTITGAVLCIGGFGFLRTWAFPLVLLLFMLPKLAIVYNQVTLPLQLLASRMAAGILTMTGIGVIREGNILDVNGHRVAVAEACNGIRFLLPLGFMAVVFAYLADPKPWMRLAILAAAIPVAILSNAVRVAASAWLPVLDSGTPHEAIGWGIFVVSLALLLPLRRFFNVIYGWYQA
jgi:exosortase